MWLATCSVSCDVLCVCNKARGETQQGHMYTANCSVLKVGHGIAARYRKQVTNNSGHWAHLLADQQAAAAPVRQARWAGHTTSWQMGLSPYKTGMPDWYAKSPALSRGA